ncbi:MAG: hypothetical protein JNL58_09695 [Planctomyces sp.]|nr:hypothetical protein [Planctomyces sp.]
MNPRNQSSVNPAQPSIRPLRVNELHTFLSHVDSEEASLLATRRVLEDLPAQCHDAQQRSILKARVEMGLEVAEKLSAQRIQILTALGRRVGIPADQVTITRLISLATPEAVTSLVAARVRLVRLINQVQAMRELTGWIIKETISINAVLVGEWMGQVTSDRYNANGRRAVETALIQFHSRS